MGSKRNFLDKKRWMPLRSVKDLVNNSVNLMWIKNVDFRLAEQIFMNQVFECYNFYAGQTRPQRRRDYEESAAEPPATNDQQ
jgi:hypothetical protein